MIDSFPLGLVIGRPLPEPGLQGLTPSLGLPISGCPMLNLWVWRKNTERVCSPLRFACSDGGVMRDPRRWEIIPEQQDFPRSGSNDPEACQPVTYTVEHKTGCLTSGGNTLAISLVVPLLL